MNSKAPTREPAGDTWSGAWILWLEQVFRGLTGWSKSMTTSVTHDFGSIAGAAQASTTTTVTGARSGDAVLVTPSADTTGIIYSGVVTANDTVTIYAKNFTAGAIDPASTTFRVIVFQQ